MGEWEGRENRTRVKIRLRGRDDTAVPLKATEKSEKKKSKGAGKRREGGGWVDAKDEDGSEGGQ
jgi:hypothetical protein